MEPIFLIITIYAVQWFVVWIGLGIVTGFEMECETAIIRAAVWPIYLPYLLIRWIYRLICQVVTYRSRKRAETAAQLEKQYKEIIARLESQHSDYIKGLMERDNKAWARGLYGDYPPVELDPKPKVKVPVKKDNYWKSDRKRYGYAKW